MIRKLTYDETRLAGGGEHQLAEFGAMHERQPGFRGSIAIQADDGSMLALNLWDSERDAMAGLSVLGPEVQRLVEPLLKEPAVLVGAGPVVENTAQAWLATPALTD